VAAKITGVELTAPSIGGGSARSAGEPPAARAPDAATQSSEVSITGAAAKLAALEQTLQTLPAADASRVSAVDAALASGQYIVDPQTIASGLMSTEQALYELRAPGG
jgi:negative regulator of flagellin synthesis FlgM